MHARSALRAPLWLPGTLHQKLEHFGIARGGGIIRAWPHAWATIRGFTGSWRAGSSGRMRGNCPTWAPCVGHRGTCPLSEHPRSQPLWAIVARCPSWGCSWWASGEGWQPPGHEGRIWPRPVLVALWGHSAQGVCSWWPRGHPPALASLGTSGGHCEPCGCARSRALEGPRSPGAAQRVSWHHPAVRVLTGADLLAGTGTRPPGTS